MSSRSARVRVRDVLDRGLGDGSGLEVQLRYRSAPLAVAALARHGDELEVTLREPFAGLAPGQAAVFYRDDVVVGGGRVGRSRRRRVTSCSRSWRRGVSASPLGASSGTAHVAAASVYAARAARPPRAV